MGPSVGPSVDPLAVPTYRVNCIPAEGDIIAATNTLVAVHIPATKVDMVLVAVDRGLTNWGDSLLAFNI